MPFGFLKKTAYEKEEKFNQIDAKEFEAEKKGDHPFYKFELQAGNSLFKGIDKQLKAYNKETEVNWFDVTRVCVLVYFFLTMIAMFSRPEFLSMAILGLAIYTLELTRKATLRLYRLILLLSVISFIYDGLFLFVLHNKQAEDQETQNMSRDVSNVAYIAVWISFVLRPVIILVFWRGTLNFRKDIRQKGEKPGFSTEAVLSDRELELAGMMSTYKGA